MGDELWEHMFWFSHVQKELDLHVVNALGCELKHSERGWVRAPEPQSKRRAWGCDQHLGEQRNKTQPESHGNLAW